MDLRRFVNTHLWWNTSRKNDATTLSKTTLGVTIKPDIENNDAQHKCHCAECRIVLLFFWVKLKPIRTIQSQKKHNF